MAIEKHAGGTTFTGEHVNLFAMANIAQALSFEIAFPGMRVSSKGSAMLTANRWSGSTKRTKRGALIDLIAFMEKEFPGYKVSDRVKAATVKA